jgi:hypothetical protein
MALAEASRRLMRSSPARPQSTPADRVPGARPARDGGERKRGTRATFDGHRAAQRHDRAAFDVNDDAARLYDSTTQHAYNGATHGCSVFDCGTPHDVAAHGYDGAAYRHYGGTFDDRCRGAHRHYGAAFDSHDDDGQHAKSRPPHPALHRGRDRPGPHRRARDGAAGQSPPPGSGCTIGARCAVGLLG